MQPDTPFVQSPAAGSADFDTLLTYRETAELLRLSTRTLDRLRETGEGPAFVHLTGRRLACWKRDALDWARSRTRPAKRTI